jgi:hypothetical protein
VIQVDSYSKYAQSITRPANVHQAIEYEIGTWVGKHLPDQRIFLTGSTQFWLNAFAANPQVGGGFGQGVVNPEIPIIHYGVPFTKGDGERTAMWLRLVGAQAVVVSGATGRDAYKEAWLDADKFRGILPELWRDGDDAVFAVPQQSTSLAHAIRAADVVARSPINVTDVEPVRRLAAALEDPSLPKASFAWHKPGEARIFGFLKPDQLIFVQVSYHPGWETFVNGKARPTGQDGLGFIVIEPQCEGPCDVRLSFTGGTEMRRARALRVLGIAAAFGWMLFWVWGKAVRLRRSSP